MALLMTQIATGAPIGDVAPVSGGREVTSEPDAKHHSTEFGDALIELVEGKSNNVLIGTSLPEATGMERPQLGASTRQRFGQDDDIAGILLPSTLSTTLYTSERLLLTNLSPLVENASGDTAGPKETTGEDLRPQVADLSEAGIFSVLNTQGRPTLSTDVHSEVGNQIPTQRNPNCNSCALPATVTQEFNRPSANKQTPQIGSLELTRSGAEHEAVGKGGISSAWPTGKHETTPTAATQKQPDSAPPPATRVLDSMPSQTQVVPDLPGRYVKKQQSQEAPTRAGKQMRLGTFPITSDIPRNEHEVESTSETISTRAFAGTAHDQGLPIVAMLKTRGRGSEKTTDLMTQPSVESHQTRIKPEFIEAQKMRASTEIPADAAMPKILVGPMSSLDRLSLWHKGDVGISPAMAAQTGLSEPVNATSSTPAHQQTHMPRHISAQIHSALAAGDSQNIEIRLDPEELGHVRIVLSPKDGGINIAIFSDKPEVLDLMRRNSDLLEADLSDIGYEDASFSFQQERDDKEKPSLERPDQWETEHAKGPPSTQAQQIIPTDSRLDLRF